jgi:hypothetical protein
MTPLAVDDISPSAGVGVGSGSGAPVCMVPANVDMQSAEANTDVAKKYRTVFIGFS